MVCQQAQHLFVLTAALRTYRHVHNRGHPRLYPPGHDGKLPAAALGSNHS